MYQAGGGARRRRIEVGRQHRSHAGGSTALCGAEDVGGVGERTPAYPAPARLRRHQKPLVLPKAGSLGNRTGPNSDREPGFIIRASASISP
jgi:hypothetical protein